MKKYILTAILALPFTSICFAKTDLSKWAGKQIYRDVPAKNETEYDESYQGNVYKIIHYNDAIMTIKSVGFVGKNGEIFGQKEHTLTRSIWDDGNWKIWRGTIYVGTTTYRQRPERLIVNEMIGSETMHTIIHNETNYHCIRC